MRLRSGTVSFGDSSVAVESSAYGTTWKLSADPLPGAVRLQDSTFDDVFVVQPWSLASKSNDAISLPRNFGVGSFGPVETFGVTGGPKRYSHAPRPYAAATSVFGSPGVSRTV